MKRYDDESTKSDPGVGMVEEPDGDWVRHEDAEAELQRLREEKAAFAGQLMSVTMERNGLKQTVEDYRGDEQRAQTALSKVLSLLGADSEVLARTGPEEKFIWAAETLKQLRIAVELIDEKLDRVAAEVKARMFGS